ncbi:hypothetical protein ANRL2_03187 [Anaerolineae bacterium]|nr:hypothetical protein ANRL2_03187 [Anaerolineae bacterium]
MKRIYLIGFRGTGFRETKFSREPALIRAGHVAFAFEGAEDHILGFHPTTAAVEAVGGAEAAIAWLKAKQTLDGTLHEDYNIFVRAVELAQQGARTAVWQLAVEVSDEDFERIRQQAITWYTAKQVFVYTFPPDEPMPDRDNCATFPRRLGLPLLDPVGQIKDYVQALETQGEPWKPKGR